MSVLRNVSFLSAGRIYCGQRLPVVGRFIGLRVGCGELEKPSVWSPHPIRLTQYEIGLHGKVARRGEEAKVFQA